jgi:hypothetical protein
MARKIWNGMSGNSAAVLSAVYDAALSDEHWPRALAAMSQEISAAGAFLVAIHQVGVPFHIEQSTYPLEQLRYYFDNSLGKTSAIV